MKPLVMVDVQSDFTPVGALAGAKGDRLVPVINALRDRFGLVVATQDWHLPNHTRFAFNHEGKTPFDEVELTGYAPSRQRA